MSKNAGVKNKKKTKHGKTETFTFRIMFNLDMDFRLPGALIVKNGNKSELFLKFVSLDMS
jgi:hypothetical protein